MLVEKKNVNSTLLEFLSMYQLKKFSSEQWRSRIENGKVLLDWEVIVTPEQKLELGQYVESVNYNVDHEVQNILSLN